MINSSWRWMPIALLLLSNDAAASQESSLAAAPEQSPNAAASPIEVRYDRYLLTVRAKDVPLTRIVSEVGRVTGAKVDTSGIPGDARATKEFEGVPLRDALGKLLEGYNFFATFSSEKGANGLVANSEFVSLQVIGPVRETAVTSSIGPPWSPTGEREARRDAMERYQAFLNAEADISDDARLVQALEGRPANLTNIFDLAFRNGDAEVRTGATRAVARALDANAESVALSPGDGEALAGVIGMLRMAAGPSAEEFLSALMVSLRNPTLKAQARDILATIRR